MVRVSDRYCIDIPTSSKALSFQPAAESFLVALVHECWEHLAPMAAQWLQLAVAPINVQSVEEVLAREAGMAPFLFLRLFTYIASFSLHRHRTDSQ